MKLSWGLARTLLCPPLGWQSALHLQNWTGEVGGEGRQEGQAADGRWGLSQQQAAGKDLLPHSHPAVGPWAGHPPLWPVPYTRGVILWNRGSTKI